MAEATQTPVVEDVVKNCPACKKPLKKAKRFYRNGAYYCNNNCFKKFQATIKASAGEAGHSTDKPTAAAKEPAAAAAKEPMAAAKESGAVTKEPVAAAAKDPGAGPAKEREAGPAKEREAGPAKERGAGG